VIPTLQLAGQRLKIPAAGGGGGSFDTLSSTDKAAHITLSGGDRTATGSSASWGNAQCVTAKTSGKFYVEMALAVKPAHSTMLGVCPDSLGTTTFCGSGSGGGSIYADGANTVSTWVNGSFATHGGHDVDVGSLPGRARRTHSPRARR
jgi:hypothetical protein